MKPIRWSAHARKKAAKREVQQNEVERTITRPDSIVPGQWRRRIFMRRYFDMILETEMLLRVVVEGDRYATDRGDTLQNIEVREI